MEREQPEAEERTWEKSAWEKRQRRSLRQKQEHIRRESKRRQKGTVPRREVESSQGLRKAGKQEVMTSGELVTEGRKTISRAIVGSRDIKLQACSGLWVKRRSLFYGESWRTGALQNLRTGSQH